MAKETEQTAVHHVAERLARRFPNYPRHVIDAEVNSALAHLVGPVRDYVSLLVEHEARDHLQALTSRSRPVAP